MTQTNLSICEKIGYLNLTTKDMCNAYTSTYKIIFIQMGAKSCQAGSSQRFADALKVYKLKIETCEIIYN